MIILTCMKTMLLQKKLVILDCDLTVVNDQRFYRQYPRQLENAVAQLLDIDKKTARKMVNDVRRRHAGAGEVIFSQLGYSMDIWRETLLQIRPEKTLLPNPRLVDSMCSWPGTKIILSNAPDRQVRRILKAVGFDPAKDFTEIIAWQKNQPLPKPSVDLLRRILRRHRCRPEEAIMIGDRYEEDLAPAQALNIPTIAIGEDPRADCSITDISELFGPLITVIASFAEDRIKQKNGKTIRRRGGPAFWITQSLRDLAAPFTLVSGKKPAIVNITLNKAGESGAVQKTSPIVLSSKIKTDVVIISTLLDEFPLPKIEKMKSWVALDLQGYARRARATGQRLIIPQKLARKIQLLKATTGELDQLDSKSARALRQCTSLITHGAEGFELRTGNNKKTFSARRIQSPDTLGAGDVLLSAFVLKFILTSDTMQAGLFAKHTVEKFLKAKRK